MLNLIFLFVMSRLLAGFFTGGGSPKLHPKNYLLLFSIPKNHMLRYRNYGDITKEKKGGRKSHAQIETDYDCWEESSD